MKEQQIIDFLKLRNYDIRKTQNARWIDQKCTPDVLSIIADCILDFTQCNIGKSFSIRDIWDNPYTNENVKMIFSKPDLNSDFSMHEYDKFFSQPIKLLAYSGILFETKTGNRNIYTITKHRAIRISHAKRNKRFEIPYFIHSKGING
ncbi:hypothetical protein FNE29_00280 [Helicobacter pylori]|nr:hypothetical protein FNE29_00280 [Helicobacter pylori]